LAWIGLRQLFVEERNAIRLELDFFGDRVDLGKHGKRQAEPPLKGKTETCGLI
jgi:hypothetical protein